MRYDEASGTGIIECNSRRSAQWWQEAVQRAVPGRAAAILRTTERIQFVLDARHSHFNDLRMARYVCKC